MIPLISNVPKNDSLVRVKIDNKYFAYAHYLTDDLPKRRMGENVSNYLQQAFSPYAPVLCKRKNTDNSECTGDFSDLVFDGKVTHWEYSDENARIENSRVKTAYEIYGEEMHLPQIVKYPDVAFKVWLSIKKDEFVKSKKYVLYSETPMEKQFELWLNGK